MSNAVHPESEAKVPVPASADKPGVKDKIADNLRSLVADGHCCAKFPSFFGPYWTQLLGCMKHHHLTPEEKTGLLWFKAADKGCGSFGTAHHAFLAWLTLGVWMEFCTGAAMSLLVILADGVYDCVTAEEAAEATAATASALGALGGLSAAQAQQIAAGRRLTESALADMQADIADMQAACARASPAAVIIAVLCQLATCFIWNYVGYWAFETKNGVWTILYLVGQFIWAITLFLSCLASFNYMTFNGIFIVTAVLYLLTVIAAFKTVIFGSICISKLHHGGNNKVAAKETRGKETASEP
eukprot:SAG31_NODE_6251_length_2102_cov_1.415876_1_plen_300_part_00